MIDWFILLVSLAALPIVFVFAFVGCQLQKEGIDGPTSAYTGWLILRFGEQLAAVTLISAIVTVTGAHGESDSVTLSLSEANFVTESESPGGVANLIMLEGFKLTNDDVEGAHCECKIQFFNSDTVVPVVPSADHDDDPFTYFELTVTNLGVSIEEFHLK
jgi:hypothetical protein